jgi:hypothetical protein
MFFKNKLIYLFKLIVNIVLNMLFYIPKINYLYISMETYRNSKKDFIRRKRRG